MIILTIRTDNPQAEIGLYNGNLQLSYKSWEAHRKLAETVHHSIDEVLGAAGKSLDDIGGIVCFKGPGSFTGLRIGLSVAGSLAYALNIPIIGIEGEDRWLERGIAKIQSGENDVSVVPVYGSPVHITEPRK